MAETPEVLHTDGDGRRRRGRLAIADALEACAKAIRLLDEEEREAPRRMLAVTITTAASMLDCSHWQIRKLLASGALPEARFPEESSCIRIPLRELRRYVRQVTKRATPNLRRRSA